MDKILVTLKRLIPRRLFRALQPAYHFGLSWLAAVRFGHPSRELIVIGVTGTTGKTTSVYLLAKVLEAAGFKTGFTSTAVMCDGAREWLNDKKMTMVGRFFTQRMLRTMVRHGCRFAIIETTSEGIVQHRHRFLNYDLLVFTGLYEEHIESHGSFAAYKAAKLRLFAHLRQCSHKFTDADRRVVTRASGLKKTELARVRKTIIANGDDPHAADFLSCWAEDRLAYTRSDRSYPDVRSVPYAVTDADLTGTRFTAAGRPAALAMLGEFNVANAMNAVSVGLALAVPWDAIVAGIGGVSGVAGRLERIDEGQPFTVIVDYAFEPNALEKLYATVALLNPRRIIHVLGATGGGRDVARRPKLGELAGSHADLVVVTNEDPYDDDPEIIIDQVALGAERAGKRRGENLFRILDRREAIERALTEAEPGDLVLITGKGSEQAIVVAGGERITWDDRAVARTILQERGSRG